MSNVPDNLSYTKDHEWIRLQGDGTAIIGITDYAQESLGDITFIEFPGAGDNFEQGDTFGVVESVKAASDLFMPASGEVLEVNEALDENPALVNDDAFGDGWILKIRLSDESQVKGLMSAEGYSAII